MTFMRVAGLLVLGSVAGLSGCSEVGPTATTQAAMPEFSQSTVKQAQTALKQDGVYPGEIDGAWSQATIVAVISFQHRHNLPPSGHLDPETLAALHVTPGPNTAAMPEQPSPSPGTGQT